MQENLVSNFVNASRLTTMRVRNLKNKKVNIITGNARTISLGRTAARSLGRALHSTPVTFSSKQETMGGETRRVPNYQTTSAAEDLVT